MMMRGSRSRMFFFGVMAGFVMLIIQGTILRFLGPVFLTLLYLLLLILSLIFSKPRFTLGVVVGYVLSFTIFVFMVFIAYNIMLYFTKF